MLDEEFIIALLILKKGFVFGLPKSKYMQKVDIDLKLTTRLANETLGKMQICRNNAKQTF